MTLVAPFQSSLPLVRRQDSMLWLRWFPSAVIFSIILISFHPFSSAISADQIKPVQQGDIANQIGFSLIGVCSIFLFFKSTPALSASAFKTPLWFIILGFLALSSFVAENPANAARAIVYTLIVIFALYTALLLPQSMNDLLNTLCMSSLLILFFCYFAVIFIPEQGVHQAVGPEGGHAGLWRGIYTHKNISTYVIAIIATIGLFIARNNRPVVGSLIFVFSLIFTVKAGSKAGMLTLPLALFIVTMAHWVTWRALKAILLLSPILLFMLVTLGAVIFPPILDILHLFSPDLSYTGRIDIWIFGLEYWSQKPWLGYGLGNFWTPDLLITKVQPIELNWDVRGIVHGHNSWLDVALSLGIFAAIASFLTFVILPIRDYIIIGSSGNAGRLAQLYATIWLYTLFSANFESFFFSRSDPVWVFFLIATMGLRITAHMSQKTRHQ